MPPSFEDKPVLLGHVASTAKSDSETDISCQDAELRRHLHRPWFRAEVMRQTGVALSSPQTERSTSVVAQDSDFARHAIAVGATGSGKSKLLEHLLTEHLQRSGSAVVIDPKGEITAQMLLIAQRIGLSPKQVTLLDPCFRSGVPGWNPFQGDLPVAQAVSDFVSVLKEMYSSWGPRLHDLITNAALIVASHGLSLYELARYLHREDYREGLLRQTIQPQNPLAYHEARAFFQEEFGAWNRSNRTESVNPVMNKIRQMLLDQYLHPLLCSRRNTLDIPRLWQEQHLVLVHLDRATLGDEGAHLLAGLLTNLLYRTALRANGSIPVVLAMDELATVERFVGSALTDIVTVARSKNLRLLVGFQHLSQLSNELRDALLGNAAVQAVFRSGYADARLAAASLVPGTPARLVRLTANVQETNRQTGQPALTTWRHAVCDAWGQPLRLAPHLWKDIRWGGMFGGTPLQTLKEIAGASGISRIYIPAADSGQQVEIERYLEGVPPHEYWFDGPAPLELIVSYPRPRFTGVERTSESDKLQHWLQILQELPVQQAVVRLQGKCLGSVRIVDVPSQPPPPDAKAFLEAVLANGQSEEESWDTLQWRAAEVERIAKSSKEPAPRAFSPLKEGEDEDDGSVW